MVNNHLDPGSTAKNTHPREIRVQRVDVLGAADRMQECGRIEVRIGAQHVQVAVDAMRVQFEAGQFDALRRNGEREKQKGVE